MLDMILSHTCLAVLATYPDDAPQPTWQVSYPETSSASGTRCTSKDGTGDVLETGGAVRWRTSS